MKKIWTMMAMALVFAGCSQEDTDSPINAYSLTGYADVESRTAFGTPGATSIPFQWSAGDYIYLGSTKSNPINNGGSNATFTFGTKPSATDVYYNISGSSAKEANVKAEQTVGNLGKNGDFGYATINNNSFTLNHATSYVWFDTTLPDGATLESITLNAGTTTIAGTSTWDGSKFGTVSNASSSISLSVINKSVSGAALSMVIFPATITDASVTYELKINGTTKYYKKNISGSKAVPAGKTWKITTDLTNAELYELRVLTFEDEDTKFTPYECTFNYAMSFYEETKWVVKWSDYIPEDQYGNGHGSYEWHDANNTELEFVKPEIDSWWGISGHAGISNYVGSEYSGDDNFLYMYDLQAYKVKGGANGSKNFCSQYGYLDPEEYATIWSPEGVLPGIQFHDGIARIIDHMYVTNTTYAYTVLVNGECDFGGSYEYTDNSTFKIVAYGYESLDDTTPTQTEFYLLNTGKRMVTDWTKWDLSVLGHIVRVEFNLVACDNGYGIYGNVIPAYFAYDDVAVRFE